ncbi:plastocyanin/azurin family copper-binding protein [Sporosarcina sp. 6E9]|uniref:plastocyanin/azurin family copper-binding protein n=1 Tax=Sporosarcina sp. 6E9 TaxID=2819235 RepID=UPI001FF07EBB|nr:plastocyanin/azurin family copper-binding protein [Sporosarcina sp. 6E9]
MGNYELFILGSLGLLTFVVVILAVIWKKTFRNMQGMMISMFFGMNVGLTAGVLLGVAYQGDLYFSTILSMVIGVLAGSLCGACFGILSVLEGVMAGLMGGMMGAMVGEMINVNQSINLIQIFLFFSISTIFVMAILKTSKKTKIENKRWLLKPLLLSILIAVYLIAGNSLAEKNEKMMNSETQHSDHLPTINNTEEFNKNSQVIAIETAKMKYSKNEIIVEKDKSVTLTLKNLDTVEHDIEIRTSFFNMIKGSKHNHGGENNLLHLHAAPKKTETLTFTVTESGVYEFYCTIPGHKESGMIGRFIVS